MASAKTTTNHNTIKKWVEARGGTPSRVKGTGTDETDPGILRIDFPGYSGEDTLEAIEWEEFFEAFEDNELAFLYQDEKNSRFNKLIARNGAEQQAEDEAEEEEEDEDEEYEEEDAEMDAVDLLESQHREVEALFEQLREAESARERGELFAELADQLAAHTRSRRRSSIQRSATRTPPSCCTTRWRSTSRPSACWPSCSTWRPRIPSSCARSTSSRSSCGITSRTRRWSCFRRCARATSI